MNKRQAIAEFLKGNSKPLKQLNQQEQKRKNGICLVTKLRNGKYLMKDSDKQLTGEQLNEATKHHLIVWVIREQDKYKGPYTSEKEVLKKWNLE